MKYPQRLDLFKAWAKAMEEGATVDKPHYRGTTSNQVTARATPTGHKRRARRLRRKRRSRKKMED